MPFAPWRGTAGFPAMNWLKELLLLHPLLLSFLIFYILADLLSVEAHGIHTIPLSPKMITQIGFSASASCSGSESEWRCAPWPFPCMRDTTIFGGIITSMCTWSGCTLSSIISHSCCSENARMNPSTALAIWPSKIRKRYFGHHIMWYWQCHSVCDNLRNLLICYSRLWFFWRGTQPWSNKFTQTMFIRHSLWTLTLSWGQGFSCRIKMLEIIFGIHYENPALTKEQFSLCCPSVLVVPAIFKT